MKKLLAILLTLILCFSLVACNSNSSSAVADYVEKNGDEIIEAWEEMFASLGDVESSIKADGNGIVCTFKISRLNNITDEQKDAIQTNYDNMSASFDAVLSSLQKELPEAQSLSFLLCDGFGNRVASVVID